MILESSYWKNDILKISNNLEKRYNQKRWSERSFFVLEKEVFIGFYIIRKLIESNKISNSLKKKRIIIKEYPIGDKKTNVMNRHEFAELYRLYEGIDTSLSIEDLCNQFIHSFVFAPFVPSGTSLVGFYFCSDRQKDKGLFYITLVNVVEIMRSIGENHPSTMKVKFNYKKNEYETSVE